MAQRPRKVYAKSMKRVRYTKYVGDLASEIEMDDLLKALSDYLLDSGFQDPYSRFSELNGEHTLENLREAIRTRSSACNRCPPSRSTSSSTA